MEIKFDVYFKKNLGTLFKENEVDLDGVEANVNLDLSLVDKMKINYKINENKYTDDVLIKDNNLIQIPFKSDVVKKGLNEFEVVAYMRNGDIKVSQTYTYDISEGIGEGDMVKNEHAHTNLDVLNSITEVRVNKWDSKAEGKHKHSISDIEGLENIEVDLSNYYTKGETDNKISDEVSKIEVVKGEKGDKGDKGDNGLTPNITIGEVTTLEPNQNATVEITGTTENPILNFGIPKGENGQGEGVGGGNVSGCEKLIARYIHTTNIYAQPNSLDLETGIFTCIEPHNFTNERSIYIRIGADGFRSEFLPNELVNSSFANLIVEVVDEYKFKIKGFNNYTSTGLVDCSKFYFELGTWSLIKLTNLNLSSYKNIKIKAFGQMGDLHIALFKNITPHITSGDVNKNTAITLGVNGNSYVQNYMNGEVIINIRENDTIIRQRCYANYFQKGFYSIHGDYIKTSTPIFRYNSIPKGYNNGVKFIDDISVSIPQNPSNSYLNGMTIEIYDLGGE